jgi:Zn-dependent protease/predicted transcriptional regulator
MRWSITLGTIAGTAIRVHATFLLFLLFIGIVVYRANGPAAAWDTLAFVTLIFICVVLHEFGHILMARRFGIKTRDVTLFPIGGVASMERMPDKPSQELLVAIAGPAVNLVIAAIILAVMGSSLNTDDLAGIGNTSTSLAMRIATANLILMAFNLIPAFPMDGGRVLRALLAMRMGKARATRIAAGIGQAFAFVLGFLGFFGNPMLIFIAFFIFIAAGAEADTAALHDATSDLSVGDAMITALTPLKPSDTIRETVDRLLRSTDNDFPVIDERGNAFGLVTRHEILLALNENSDMTPISAIMRPADLVLNASDPLEKALVAFETSNTPALLVLDNDRQATGMITRASIAQIMLVRTARPGWAIHRGGILAESLTRVSRGPRAASSSPSR